MRANCPEEPVTLVVLSVVLAEFVSDYYIAYLSPASTHTGPIRSALQQRASGVERRHLHFSHLLFLVADALEGEGNCSRRAEGSNPQDHPASGGWRLRRHHCCCPLCTVIKGTQNQKNE